MGQKVSCFAGGVHGRFDHITNVKGLLFSPVSVEEVVRGIPELVPRYIITKRNKDAIRIPETLGIENIRPALT